MPSAAAAVAKFSGGTLAEEQSSSTSDACKSITIFMPSAFSSVGAMLDPAANVDYAARFLKQLRAREGSWTMAVARYHAGPNNDPAQKQYVCRVMENMVATGFGNWTQKARMFCNKWIVLIVGNKT